MTAWLMVTQTNQVTSWVQRGCSLVTGTRNLRCAASHRTWLLHRSTSRGQMFITYSPGRSSPAGTRLSVVVVTATHSDVQNILGIMLWCQLMYLLFQIVLNITVVHCYDHNWRLSPRWQATAGTNVFNICPEESCPGLTGINTLQTCGLRVCQSVMMVWDIQWKEQLSKKSEGRKSLGMVECACCCCY